MTDDQKVYKYVLNFTHRQGNTNQNTMRLSPYTCYDDCYQEVKT